MTRLLGWQEREGSREVERERVKLDGTTQATEQHYRDGFYERVETS